jgi:RNA polymerase sigma-70 factor, ECF subfamily
VAGILGEAPVAARDDLEEEFREFVAARSFALLRTAYLLCGDWSTAEDLLQTALTKTYLAWKRLGEIEAVEPYARRVLVNTATSWWRRRWHGERPTEVLPERAVPDRIDEHVERDALWRHVRALPARQRAVLVLRFYEDLSETQTAALLNISTGTVKSQTFRALNTLRRRLGAESDQLTPGLAGGSMAAPVTPPARAAGPAAAPVADQPVAGPVGPGRVPNKPAGSHPPPRPRTASIPVALQAALQETP